RWCTPRFWRVVSLLFGGAARAWPAGSPLDLPLILVMLSIAAVAGDAVNYAIRYRVGPRGFTSETSRLPNKEHLLRTQRFYEKYGGKTIILARFMPIIRTFAPFVAGIGNMRYGRLSLDNIVGGIVWVTLFMFAGRFFGNLPIVRDNFSLVIVAI